MRLRPLRTLLVVKAAAVAAYVVGARPWLLRWGATDDEVSRPMPGDEVVPGARVRTTRAVDIAAAPLDVWGWLVQIGQGRGGLYSYTRLENLFGLRFENADHLDPAWELQVGDLVRFVPEERGDLGLVVLVKEPPHVLVLGAPGRRDEALAQGLPWVSWTFVVEEAGPGRSRLLVRVRSDYTPTLAGLLANQVVLEPVQFLMERKMLLGLRERAERSARARQASLAPDELEAVPAFQIQHR